MKRLKSLTSGGWDKLRFVVAGAIVVIALATWGTIAAIDAIPDSDDGGDASPTATSAAEQPATEKLGSYTDQTIDVVDLLGDTECSEEVNLDEGPRGYNYFRGPSEAQVHELSTGVVGFITETFDSIGGFVCFTGPAGEEVTVTQVPFVES